MTLIISNTIIGLGVGLWFFGTLPLLGHRSVAYKLHSLSVADTFGSLLIIAGLFLRIPREWPLLLLAVLCLALWNTMTGYILANCAGKGRADA